MGEMADELFEMEMLYNEELEGFIYECFEDGEWPSQNGPIKVSDMTDSHIRNAINYMKHNPDMPHAEIGGIEFLERELKARTG